MVTDISADCQQLSPSKPTTDKQSLDLLWLEACTSVLNANLYSFESYLLAVDGKLDRELTVQVTIFDLALGLFVYDYPR